MDAMISNNTANTVSVLWTLIEPQNHDVRENLEILIHQSLAKEKKRRKKEKPSRSEMFAQIFKDVKAAKKNSSSPYPYIEEMGIDIDLPSNFNEKEAYRKHLEEKYR